MPPYSGALVPVGCCCWHGHGRCSGYGASWLVSGAAPTSRPSHQRRPDSQPDQGRAANVLDHRGEMTPNPMPRCWFSLAVPGPDRLRRPVGTARVDPKIVPGSLGRSAVAAGEPSMPTRVPRAGPLRSFRPASRGSHCRSARTMVASHQDQDLPSRWPSAVVPARSGASRTTPGGRRVSYAFLFPEQAGSAPRGSTRVSESRRICTTGR
jgi:hypothetical protein